MLGKVNRAYFNGIIHFKKVDLKEALVVKLIIASSLATVVGLAILYALVNVSIEFFYLLGPLLFLGYLLFQE
jgi:hypothetical protein